MLWSVIDKGDSITVTPSGGDCGSFEGVSTGLLTARLSGKDCPDFTSGGYFYDMELRNGFLSMDQSRAFFDATLVLVAVVTRNGANAGTCTETVDGPMTIDR